MRFINFLFIFLILISSGCQKIMREQETQIAKINSPQEMNIALDGLYSRLAIYVNNLGNNWGYNSYSCYPNNFSDDMNSYWHGLNPGFNLPNSYAVQQKESPGFEGVKWALLYKIGTCSNNIIYQFENKKQVRNDLKFGLGEAHLIRAYTYFNLVRIYNQVPIVKDIQVNYTLSKSSTKDIYSFIESDLLKAIALLPRSKMSARIPNESPCRGSAKAMLAEVYLTMAGYPLKDETKYIAAAQIAKEVIDSSLLFGFSLLPDFGYLWNDKHKINNETILALFFTNKINPTINRNPQIGSFYYDFNSTNNGSSFVGIYLTSYPDYAKFSTGGDLPGWKFFNHYPESYRKQVTFQKLLPYIGPYSIDTVNMKYSFFYGWKQCNLIDSTLGATSYRTNVFYKKFNFTTDVRDTSKIIEQGILFYDTTYRHYYPGASSDPFNDKNIFNLAPALDQPIYIYRFAHTLLTYAEAKAHSGQLDASAYEAVNMVRRRANKVDINSPSKYDLTPELSAKQFADSVVWERAWEFCGEPEGRWYDLVRLEMVEQLPKLWGGGPAMTKDDYFEIMPESEIALDPNLK